MAGFSECGHSLDCRFIRGVEVYQFTFHLVLGDIAAIRTYAYKVGGRAV